MKKNAFGMTLTVLLTVLLSVSAVTQTPGVQETDRVTISLSAIGDCTLGWDERFGQENRFDQYISKYSPDYFFENVASIFENDDLTIANFEGTLTESRKAADKTYTFRAPAECAEILTAAHIDAVNLANNHTYDYLEVGYKDTLETLSAYGIDYFGNGIRSTREIKGIKVGMLGYKGFDKSCKSAIKDDIQTLRNEGVLLVIVSFHWGIERDNYPNELQKELGRYAIDCGADLVLGHHPHVLQGIESYNNRYIVYSLANFCFGGNRNPVDKDSMIFRQRFTFENGILQNDNPIDIVPVRISSVTDRNDYKPTPLTGDAGDQVIERLITYSKPFMKLRFPQMFRTFIRSSLK